MSNVKSAWLIVALSGVTMVVTGILLSRALVAPANIFVLFFGGSFFLLSLFMACVTGLNIFSDFIGGYDTNEEEKVPRMPRLYEGMLKTHLLCVLVVLGCSLILFLAL